MWLRYTMEPAAGSPDSPMPLRKYVNGSGDLQSRGELEPHCNCREQRCKKRAIVIGVALTVVFLALLIAVIVLATQRYECPSADLGSPAGPACPEGWVGYRGKCYYFSEDQRDWASSQTHCSALNASLAGIDTWQEMHFMMRHKGKSDHWIGLRRDRGVHWKWANGTDFVNLLPIEGRGNCAYLNDLVLVSSSQCTDERFWICTKPDVFTKGKDTAGEGD